MESAIVRWSGRGAMRDLVTAAKKSLRAEGMDRRVVPAGGSLILESGDPVSGAMLLREMPGVSWVAVGYACGSMAAASEGAVRLAKSYLRKGKSFAVLPESSGAGGTPMDFSGAVTAAILGAADSVRVNEESPGVVFRVAFDRGHGAVGVELARGPGGTPTGARRAVCMVSGGMHSSVVAWKALLSGFALTLVHLEVDDGSLREVARLYAELSHRGDPSRLRLEVIDGGSFADALRAASGDRPVFCGFHAECGGVPDALAGLVQAPLLILNEEEYRRELAQLSLHGHGGRREWGSERRGVHARRSFGGKRADMHGVLDGLRAMPKPRS